MTLSPVPTDIKKDVKELPGEQFLDIRYFKANLFSYFILVQVPGQNVLGLQKVPAKNTLF